MDSISKDKLENKHILGIDYGQKFTGIASFYIGKDPYPLPWGRLKYVSDSELIHSLKKIIEDEFIDIVVIGIPYFTDGKESTMTKTIKSFFYMLQDQLDIPTYSVDETLTTFEAKERMSNDPRYNFKVDLTKIDELCAAIIIEEFLKNSSD
tara:strand:+ start:168 stop:620 length:453 start_codon:yes stop_codon:yes gene_type:complete